MSTLKKLKSWFVVEEEGSKKPTTSANRSPNAAPKTSPSTKEPATNTTPTTPVTAGEGKISERFTNILLEAMEKADQPGFDYLEFKKALQNLKKMNMDEGTRFKSAYAMAQSMEVTPAQLIASAKHYLSTLSNEEQKFGKALQNQQQSQISDRRKEITDLDKNILQLEDQIKELQKKITAARKKKAATQKGIDQAAAKIQSTQNDFSVTYRAITGQIQGDIANMEQYLK